MPMTDGGEGVAAPAEAPSAADPSAAAAAAEAPTVPVVRVGNKRRASKNGSKRNKRAKIWKKEMQELIVQIEAMLEWSAMYFQSAQLVTYRYVHMICTFNMYIPYVHSTCM